MSVVKVTTPDKYDIVIERGILKNCGEYVKGVTKAKKALVITDSNVMELYLDTVLGSLKESGFETYSFIFTAGEENKNFSTIEAMLDTMCEFSLTRSDIVVSLGGGVCSDLSGFAAAIYLRGIDFVNIPTSLLSMVDASVGGKTGCDLKFGKNLAGAFHNPKAVLIDPDVLSTLPQRYYFDGMAEAIKTGVIKSEALFCAILNNTDIASIIEQCVSIKRDVVENDFKESGERMLLNFGHTLGHAIELYYNFSKLTHGEAVAIGMVLITKAAAKNGICDNAVLEELRQILKANNLPTETDIDIDTLLELSLRDKKARGNTLNVVVPTKIGNACVQNIEFSKLGEFFK